MLKDKKTWARPPSKPRRKSWRRPPMRTCAFWCVHSLHSTQLDARREIEPRRGAIAARHSPLEPRPRTKPAQFGGQIAPQDNTASTPSGRCATLPFSKILTVVFVLVTIVVAVFPVTIVMVMFPIFVPFSFFAVVPLTIAPIITVMLVPFAIVSARYSNRELLR